MKKKTIKRWDVEIVAEYFGMHWNEGVQCWEDEKNMYTKHSLYYNTSWDALMPVIKKIRDSYQGEQHHIKSCELYDYIEAMILELNIKWTFDGVVAYIKWENSLKKK